MSTEIKKPFYKKISFIICVSVLSICAIIALSMFVLMTIRYNIYRNAVDAVNAAVNQAITQGKTEFTVNLNGSILEYYTKNPAASTGNNAWDFAGEVYYLTNKFYLADFATFDGSVWHQNIIDNSDNEIWVYLTKPLAGYENDFAGSLLAFKNLHGHVENLSFLPSALNGGTTQENIAYIACAVTFSVGTFVALVPVLFMSLAPKFANKKPKKSPSTQQVQLQ